MSLEFQLLSEGMVNRLHLLLSANREVPVIAYATLPGNLPCELELNILTLFPLSLTPLPQ